MLAYAALPLHTCKLAQLKFKRYKGMKIRNN